MRRIAFAVALAACHGGSARDPKAGCDTTTDDGVRAAYHKVTGKTLPAKDDRGSCVDRAYTFPALVKIGSFADDRGCDYEGVLYGCTFGGARDLQAKVLADAGWATADHGARETLISAYWGEVYGIGVESTGDDFPADHPFTAPAFAWNPDGSVTYTYWYGQSHGMTCGTHHYKIEDHVNADGSNGESKPLEDFDQKC